jgi:hypothetical protein
MTNPSGFPCRSHFFLLAAVKETLSSSLSNGIERLQWLHESGYQIVLNISNTADKGSCFAGSWFYPPLHKKMRAFFGQIISSNFITLFGFDKNMVNISLIRQIQNPFIPLFFHWR